MAVIIQIRRDLAAQWTLINPTLADGELGFEKNTGNLKIGDGITPWNSLAYYFSGSGSLLTGFVDGETPAGLIDGTNGNFVLSQVPLENSLRLYLNGQRLSKGIDYSNATGSTSIVMTTKPYPTDQLRADFAY